MNVLQRIYYIVSRGISRPRRSFAAVVANRPVLDILLVAALALAWCVALEALAEFRVLKQQQFDLTVLGPGAAESAARFALALVVTAIYGFTTSVAASFLGGRPRLISTLLCNLLATALAFAVTACPIAIIRLVDSGSGLPFSSVSHSVIEVAPWIYCLVLLYLAQIKIHKTVPNRAVAYLVLGALPLLLVYSAARWFLPGRLPLVGF